MKRSKTRVPATMTHADFGGRPSDERLDCVVRAFTVITGKPYNEVHAEFKAAGRKDGHKTRDTVTDKVCRKLGIRYLELPRRMMVARTMPHQVSVARFLKDMRYCKPVVALVRGHAFAVREGQIADYQAVRPGCMVIGYYYT
jgi:hypothetical protein